MAVAAAGTAAADGEASSPAVSAVDFRGVRVELAAPAGRIVCLLESALSALCMLGADDAIVGAPAEALRGETGRLYARLDPRFAAGALPTPGNWDFVNLESVIALRPDLVILWAAQRESVSALEGRGLKVYGVELRSLADIHREVLDLGRLTGRPERARELVAFAAREAEALRAAVARSPRPRPRAYFMWGQSPLDTAGRASAAHELLDLAGAINVCPDPREHVVARMEDVLAWRPQVIVMWPSNLRPRDLAVRDGWRGVPAAIEGRIHRLPSAFLCDFWTLKYLWAAWQVAAWCHPEVVLPERIAENQRRILTALYGPRGERLLP